MSFSASPNHPQDRYEQSGGNSEPEYPEITPEIARDLELLRRLLLGEEYPSDAPAQTTPSSSSSNIQAQLFEELNLRNPPPTTIEVNYTQVESEPSLFSPEKTPEASHKSPLIQPDALSVENNPENPTVAENPVETPIQDIPNSSIAEDDAELPSSPFEASPTADSDLSPEDLAMQQLQNLFFGGNVKDLQGKVDKIEHQLFDPDALMTLLIPIIIELLDRKVRDSKEEMAQALFPIVDRLIWQRSKEDKIAMSNALATVIPDAISQQIREDPETIIQAISPMMGAAISDQLLHDRDTVIAALAPAMGRAIKQQITLERDVMVDAMYPIVGATVTRYLGEALQEINEKVSHALSFQGIKRRVVAASQGISTAELILQESLPCQVQAAFLIHKASGLTIADAQRSDTLKLEPDMISGMLTAIRSFVNDCIAQGETTTELNEIEYGDSKILLEVAGYCYLAVIVRGNPPRPFLVKVRKTLSSVIQEYGDAIENYDGDPDTIPSLMRSQITNLLEYLSPKASEAQKSPWLLIGIGVAAIALIALPWGWWRYRQHLNRQTEVALEQSWYNATDLSVYNLDAAVTGKKIVLTGRVPHSGLRDRAVAIARAYQGDRRLDNQIIAVNLPPDPDQTAAEVQRVAQIFNQKAGVKIATEYQPQFDDRQNPLPGTVAVAGTIQDLEDAIAITQAFNEIPGVGKIVNTVAVAIAGLDMRFYFRYNSAQIEPQDLQNKIPLIQKQLNQYPEIKLQLVGYSPPNEPKSSAALAQQRAEAVKQALVKRGIDPQRLRTAGQVGQPSDVTVTAADWLGRCVRLEVVLPTLQP
ncbi:MAG: OmpA family protein [Jaaginema sp. PMC 1079.18]|nr:OmpA family protein [Jaaginema sp. PMC 1080.18]MEC4851311.1 OmpA family protein [Jaaginema sp. PMC 1079.18]MEC4866316.1 OmpA family protein [Jaaginema sp. PMC 1078.18]